MLHECVKFVNVWIPRSLLLVLLTILCSALVKPVNSGSLPLSGQRFFSPFSKLSIALHIKLKFESHYFAVEEDIFSK